MNSELFKKKIMDPKAAIRWREALRIPGRRLVVTNGCFDILHRGHAEYLSNARGRGDALLVALNSDASVRRIKGESRPINCENDRAYLLACFSFVDAVVVFNTPTCTELLVELKPDIYVKGGDYTIDTINAEEKAAMLQIGIKIEIISLVPGFSSSNTLEKMKG